MFISIMLPIASAIGLGEFSIGLLVWSAVNSFFVLYQNPCYMTSFGAMRNTIVQKDCVSGAVLHAIVTIICGFVTVFYWNLIGFTL
jgi:hypothetical protein